MNTLVYADVADDEASNAELDLRARPSNVHQFSGRCGGLNHRVSSFQERKIQIQAR